MLDNEMETMIVQLFDLSKRFPAATTKIDPKLVGTDHTYQRPLQPSLVKQHVKDKSWYNTWAAVLARREDGSLWTINGQHHIAAAREVNLSVVFALVLPSQGIEYEKELFNLYQKWRKLGKPKQVL